MQFIPGTWKSFAKDGNNDGVASPHNVFDAAVAAGTYLCSGGGDLSQPAAQRAALLRYNRSDAYGALVLRWAAAYGGGVAVLPDGTGHGARHHADPARSGSGAGERDARPRCCCGARGARAGGHRAGRVGVGRRAVTITTVTTTIDADEHARPRRRPR